MKKITLISLLILLFFSQAGYYAFYVFQQYELKEEAKEELLTRVPESSLEIINEDANKNDIEWEEEGKEFSLHGQMYDVARIEKVNGKTLIYCLNDKKEEQLLEELSKAVSSGSDQTPANSHGQHSIKFQLPDYIILAEFEASGDTPVIQEHSANYTVALTSTISEVLTPPPDLNFKSKNSDL